MSHPKPAIFASLTCRSFSSLCRPLRCRNTEEAVKIGITTFHNLTLVVHYDEPVGGDPFRVDLSSTIVGGNNAVGHREHVLQLRTCRHKILVLLQRCYFRFQNNDCTMGTQKAFACKIRKQSSCSSGNRTDCIQSISLAIRRSTHVHLLHGSKRRQHDMFEWNCLVVRHSKFIRVVDKVDHDKLSRRRGCFPRRLYDSGLIEGCRVGINGKNNVTLAESFDTSKDHDLLFREVEDWRVADR